ncbi:MAG: DUF1566 domain-containing protein, partial [Bacteroidales bacterium]|nr:DUF1566 domain-containing protein [Bacteroidales bacterium]
VLTDVGVPSYTERGFVYGLSSMPTIDNTISKLPVAVTEDKSFQATVTNLEDGNTYYVRAYAINKAGTAYSTNEVRLTVQKTLPIVKTESITNINIAMGRATLSGTIEDVGEPVYTERGFVYGTSHNPMLEDATKKSVTGSGTGTFMANLADLVMGEVYYARAYATNEVGTAYGDEMELDFHAVLPEVNTMPITNISIANGVARFNAMVKSVGDPAYMERGFVYGEQHEPTIEQDTKRVVTGQGIGEFYADITGFETGKYYYVRAYVKTESNAVYGKEEILDFSPVLPVVKTLDVLNIDASSVTLKAKIESLGDPVYTEAGFVYGTMPNPLLDGVSVVKEIVEGTGIGNYEKTIDNLNTGVSYYVRAYLRNENYIAYGDVVSFKAESAKSMVVPGYETLMVQKEDLGVGTWSTADAMCKGSTVDGYNDWRLPTKEELMILYNNRNLIGGFSDNIYWSLSQESGYPSWHYHINFYNGSMSTSSSGTYRVRAVRTITE